MIETPTIVDSHIHFWDSRLRPYPWLAKVPKISDAHLPQDLDAQAQGVDLQGIVFVEAGARAQDGLDEARWVTELAAREPRIGAIVAHAPLQLGEDARPHLDALAELPLVHGVRRIVQSDEVDYCVRPEFVGGVRLLSQYDFSFDICIRAEQLPYAIQLADACPDVRFVLDHFGKPRVRDGILDPWRKDLAALAHYPNVSCKLSGLATEADHERWTSQQLQPYIDIALEAFGADRVMYGGDWPVSRLAIGYREWIETLMQATSGLGESAQRKLFAENAAATYRCVWRNTDALA